MRTSPRCNWPGVSLLGARGFTSLYRVMLWPEEEVSLVLGIRLHAAGALVLGGGDGAGKWACSLPCQAGHLKCPRGLPVKCWWAAAPPVPKSFLPESLLGTSWAPQGLLGQWRWPCLSKAWAHLSAAQVQRWHGGLPCCVKLPGGRGIYKVL